MRGRRVIVVHPPVPLGEVIVAPAALTGRAEADVARAMTAAGATDVEAKNAANRPALPPAPSGAPPMTALGTMMGRVLRFG